MTQQISVKGLYLYHIAHLLYGSQCSVFTEHCQQEQIFKPNQEAKQDTSYGIKSVEKRVNKIQKVEQESMKKVS